MLSPMTPPPSHLYRLPPPFCPGVESFVEWTPRGSYLTTVHRQGVAVWGGKSFNRIQRVG